MIIEASGCNCEPTDQSVSTSQLRPRSNALRPSALDTIGPVERIQPKYQIPQDPEQFAVVPPHPFQGMPPPSIISRKRKAPESSHHSGPAGRSPAPPKRHRRKNRPKPRSLTYEELCALVPGEPVLLPGRPIKAKDPAPITEAHLVGSNNPEPQKLPISSDFPNPAVTPLPIMEPPCDPAAPFSCQLPPSRAPTSIQPLVVPSWYPAETFLPRGATPSWMKWEDGLRKWVPRHKARAFEVYQ